MSVVADIITTDQLHELWGCGFTVVPRFDAYEALDKLIPAGVAYQWCSAPDDPDWKPVPYSRHDGIFAPHGTPGDITHGNLHLCERPKAEVDGLRRRDIAKVHKQVADWADRFSEFSGGARVVSFDGALANVTEVKAGGAVEQRQEDVYADRQQKTLETTVAIPKDMQEYIPAIFAERDRIEKDWVRPDRSLAPGKITDEFYAAVDKDPAAPWWPTLRAIILPHAIEAVRAKLKESTDAAGPAD